MGAERQITRRYILVENVWINLVEIQVLSRDNECNKHSFANHQFVFEYSALWIS